MLGKPRVNICWGTESANCEAGVENARLALTVQALLSRSCVFDFISPSVAATLDVNGMLEHHYFIPYFC